MALVEDTADGGLAAPVRDVSGMLAVLSGLSVATMTVATRDGAELAQRLRRLPPRVGAIFVVGAGRRCAREAQQMLIDLGERPFVTEDDLRAITLTAATLLYLGGLGRPVSSARVLVVGAPTVSVVVALLLAAGIGQIAVWVPGAAGVPLEQACRDADVVINLLVGDPGVDVLVRRTAWDRPCGSVIGIRHVHELLLALPGLARAVAGSIGPLIDVEVYDACVRGLVAATPPGWTLPSLTSRVTTYQVAVHAARVFSPFQGPTTG
ncbi:hypothetical protein BKA01_003091 [Pseudonocardia eucalypti]|nr:hypothetical protein [Pseudonocardia eucalypti]